MKRVLPRVLLVLIAVLLVGFLGRRFLRIPTRTSESSKPATGAGSSERGRRSIPPKVTFASDPEADPSIVAVEVEDALTEEPVTTAEVTLSGLGRELRFAHIGSGRYECRIEAVETRSWSDGVRTTVQAPGFEALTLRSWPPRELDRDASVARVGLAPLGDLEVVLVDPSGMPLGVEGIEVRVSVPDEAAFATVWPREAEAPIMLTPLLQATTDADGVARFSGLISGSGYGVKSKGIDAFAPSPRRTIQIAAGVNRVSVQVHAGAKIVGRVLDSWGEPGNGFRIICKAYVQSGEEDERVDPSHSRSGGYAPEASVTADADGRFVIDAFDPGHKKLEFSRTTQPGNIHEAFELRLDVTPGEVYDCGTVGPVMLSEGGVQIIGRAVDENGNALPGCEIGVMAETDRSTDVDGESDENGLFQVAGLPPGRVSVFGRKSSFGENGVVDLFAPAEQWETSPGEVKEIVLVLRPQKVKLRPGGEIQVRVLGDDGKPVDRETRNRSRLSLVADDGGIVQVGQREIDGTSGERLIQLGRPSPGNYRVLAVAGSLVSIPSPCTVSDGSTTFLELTMLPSMPITGRVTDDSGQPIRAKVTRSFRRSPPFRRSSSVPTAETNEQGEFVLYAVAPGDVGSIVVFAPEYDPVLIDGVTDGDVGTITLRAKVAEEGR